MKSFRYLVFVWTTVIATVCNGSLLAGNFKVDKKVSEVAVNAKASPSHTFTSVAKEYSYDIDIDPESLEVSKAVFSFKFSDLDSNKAKRDKKMRNWMDVSAHPEAKFTLKEVEDRAGQKIGKGSFFMHGVSKDIEIPFSVTRDGDNVILDGEVTFSYEDWDLEIIRLFYFLTVNPNITPRFHLVGVLGKGDAS